MDIQTLAQRLHKNLAAVIRGKDDVIDKVILCTLCGGHILLEDLPGTGKTTMIKALAQSLDMQFTRVQFTPDLLPTDLTGVHIYDQKNQTFVFRPGPVFTNILLGDEINRATPRTQSSLLECMEERQVTVDGETRQLAAPFLVAATQNPVEIQGTFPLPEAQLDRFFMRLAVGYPDEESERDMLTGRTERDPLTELSAVATAADLLDAQEQVRGVHIADNVKDYIVAIASATRTDEKIRMGVSPRGSLAVMRAAQGHAGMAGRDFVLPDDVKAVCPDVLCHRILCKAAAHAQAEAAARVMEQILNRVPAPEIR